ncbi:MAG: hypothetical protein KIT84_07350 [Labilithrix sp.]|nr:hypothetical protein [Labilithrix sp.]MCW5810811.1 hypothetical protein [Labilithrix sp.]
MGRATELRRALGTERARTYLAAALCAAVVVVFLWHIRLFDTVADDAFITFRYSQNLARGRGAVWNAGERVEGYSNFLWMVLLAVAHLVARADVTPAARLLSALCAAGTVVALFALVARVTRSLFWATVAGAGLACCSSFAAHARNGLESSAFALLIVLVALGLARESVWLLTVALVGVSLCRFEGVLIAALAGITVALVGLGTKTGWTFLRAAAYSAPPYLLWTLWRYAYYGHLLPNSVAAKQGRAPELRFAHGAAYVKGFFGAESVVLGLFLAGAIALVVHLARRQRKPAPPALVFVLLASVVYTAFIVWIGGCWMPAWRMMAHVAPAVVALGVLALSRVSSRRTASVRLRVAGRVVVLALLVPFGIKQVRSTSAEHENLAPRVVYWRDQVLALGEAGRWLKRTLPRDATVATFAAGALPYYFQGSTIDVLGLTDAHIARGGKKDPNANAGHVSSDWPYVLERKPEVYVSTLGAGFAATEQPVVDKHMSPGYVPVVFKFLKTTNPQGSYLTLMIAQKRLAGTLRALEGDPDVIVARRP